MEDVTTKLPEYCIRLEHTLEQLDYLSTQPDADKSLSYVKSEIKKYHDGIAEAYQARVRELQDSLDEAKTQAADLEDEPDEPDEGLSDILLDLLRDMEDGRYQAVADRIWLELHNRGVFTPQITITERGANG